MLIIAEQKNTRQTPRKVRLVTNSVRKLPLVNAIKQLAVLERKASLMVMKVVRQAIASAQHNHGLSIDDLKLKNIIVNEGTTYKRFRAVSRGRAHNILKRTCHIRVILETQDKSKTAEKPKKTADKKIKPVQKVASVSKTSTSKVKTKTTKKQTIKKTTKVKK